jgi:hypothetical protein
MHSSIFQVHLDYATKRISYQKLATVHLDTGIVVSTYPTSLPSSVIGLLDIICRKIADNSLEDNDILFNEDIQLQVVNSLCYRFSTYYLCNQRSNLGQRFVVYLSDKLNADGKDISIESNIAQEIINGFAEANYTLNKDF